MPSESLAIKNLTKVYPGGRVALRGLDLEISAGVFGLLGPNGAGKTTVMETSALEREPEGGRILYRARDAWRSPAEGRRLLGLIPQHFGFLPHLSGRETLQLGAALSGYSPRALRERIDWLLKRVRLDWAAARRVETYSRGMRQRLGIAWSLLADPAIWLLDEPTSGLDPEERVAFRELLAEEGARRIAILSTHIVEDVERCCEKVGVLVRGQIVFHGAPSELTRTATGQVWEWESPPDEVNQWAEDPRVVLVRALGEQAQIRAVASEAPVPLSQARHVSPTLEDAYLHLLGGFRAAESDQPAEHQSSSPSSNVPRSPAVVA